MLFTRRSRDSRKKPIQTKKTKRQPDEQIDLKELLARVDASADLPTVLKILTSRGSGSESVLRLGVRITIRPVITCYLDVTRRLEAAPDFLAGNEYNCG
ncbi:hypothetical protein CY34DRAFT_802922 [Suillus luteus UH-Slu-Lm8-n1]|uniref:Uncharacterized protein n=1 Tax=Suillus luteus UH-Slu-Lm8-n1 TaxID=930992 RepID=A0A0D0B2H6_9AGAM|nr:hypothetical protein CY34DRAFT_802922 [Suillus luteus UH-Slu-Lm8-n1]